MNLTRRCIRGLFQNNGTCKSKPSEVPKSFRRSKATSRLFGEPQLQNNISKPRNETDDNVPFLLRTKIKSRFTEEEDNRGDDDPFPEDDLPEDCKKMMMSFKFNSSVSDIQLLRLVLTVAVLVFSFTINVLKKRYFFGLEWGMVVMASISGNLVSEWAIRVMVSSIGGNLFSRKRVLYSVYCLRNALQNCIWLAVVLMVWECKIWLCLLVGLSIWVLKALAVKVLALSFYVSEFLDRIRESLLDQYVMEKLSGQVLEGEQGGVITVDHVSRLNGRNISGWIMKRLIKTVRNGLMSALGEDDAMVQITSENQAKDAAEKIFEIVAKPKCCYLYREDLIRFFGEDEPLMTMRLLESKPGLDDRNEPRIFIGHFQSWVVNAFRERRALVLSLNDTKTAINKVDQMLNVIVGVVAVLIWLLIFEVATIYFLIILSFQFLLAFFILGNTSKSTFRATVFFFVMHPFDVGDRVELDRDQMVVERMHILTTVFLKGDSGEKIYYPNSDLYDKPIKNYCRSPGKEHVFRM